MITLFDACELNVSIRIYAHNVFIKFTPRTKRKDLDNFTSHMKGKFMTFLLI